MKKIIIFLIVFATLFIAQDAYSQPITYSGFVEYKQISTTIAKGSGSKGYNWNVDFDDKYIIEGTFYVTFTGGVSPMPPISMFELTSIEEDIHFEHTVNDEANEEEISTSCYDGKMVFKRHASPGDSRTYKLAVKSIRLDPEKPCITGGYLGVINDKYSIMLFGEIKADVTFITYESETFPCLDSNPPPHSLTYTSKMDIPIAVFAEKVFDGSNILEGRSVVTDIHSTDCNLGSVANMTHGDVDCAHDANITVSWTLVKRTKCEELQERIDFIKIIRKTYADQLLRDNIKEAGGDHKDYQAEVEKRVMEETHSGNGTPGKAKVLMETTAFYNDPECTSINTIEITGEVEGTKKTLISYDAKGKEVDKTEDFWKLQQDWEELYGEKAGQCLFEAAVRHEECHVKQFVKQGKIKSIDDRAERELEAFRIEQDNLQQGLVDLDC